MDGPTVPATYSNTVRIGYARVSARTQDLQLQLDALTAADCRDVVVETASTRAEQPKLRATLGTLKPGDTLVIYKPDRIARSMKELLVLLEDQLHGREINLHILTGICAGLHRPTGATIADEMLFMVAEMERELIRERTLDGLAAAHAPKAAAAAALQPWTRTQSPSPSAAEHAANPSRSPVGSTSRTGAQGVTVAAASARRAVAVSTAFNSCCFPR